MFAEVIPQVQLIVNPRFYLLDRHSCATQVLITLTNTHKGAMPFQQRLASLYYTASLYMCRHPPFTFALAAQQFSLTIKAISDQLSTLPPERAPNKAEWQHLSQLFKIIRIHLGEAAREN
jgi:hypothetical protein